MTATFSVKRPNARIFSRKCLCTVHILANPKSKVQTFYYEKARRARVGRWYIWRENTGGRADASRLSQNFCCVGWKSTVIIITYLVKKKGQLMENKNQKNIQEILFEWLCHSGGFQELERQCKNYNSVSWMFLLSLKLVMTWIIFHSSIWKHNV